MRLLLYIAAVATVLSFAVLSNSASAQAVKCYYSAGWAANGGQPCSPPEPDKSELVTVGATTLMCKTGTPPGGTAVCEVNMFEAGIPFLGSNTCHSNGTSFGPYFVSMCGGDDEGVPAAGKAPLCDKEKDCSSDGRRDGSGLVGDPVDLTTGAMSLYYVDIDLGGGLRFARHYASNRPSESVPSLQPMGPRWVNNLEWGLTRSTSGGRPSIIVREPFGRRIVFFQDGSVYRTASVDDGLLAVDSATQLATYTSASGVRVTFNNANPNRAVQIQFPDELPINVTRTSTTTTYARGPHSLIITNNAAGRISQVRAFRGTTQLESWTYGPLTGNLTSIQGPDPSTATNLVDRTTWTFTYDNSSRVTKVERHTTSSPSKITLGAWAYNAQGRVTSVDEQDLAQPLTIAYPTPQTGEFQADVRNSSGTPLAKFVSVSATPKTNRNGTLLRVDNGAAPVPGAPGVDVDFIAQTTIAANSPLINVRTDKRGHKTLYEGYDEKGRPTTTVKGWVDGPTSPGTFSPDDGFEVRRDVTLWHPALRTPLIEQSPSVLPGAGQRVTTYDYDDPANPNNIAAPNEAPTTRLHRRLEDGYTLNESGAVVQLGSPYTTTYFYDAAGRLEIESGPRPENYTKHFFDQTTGFRTATRRYINGPSSAYLETAYSNFDDDGNPQAITDPNGQVTSVTYDEANRPRTVTPPFSGGVSTITFSYDIDGNLKTVQFPPDSFNQPYVLEMRYDTKNRLTHLYDSLANAVVFGRRYDGLITRETTYSGFVSLASPGTIRSDASFDYDLSGRLTAAHNPLVALNQTTYTPDANGNPQSITDENGKVDTRIFDALDRLEQISQVRGTTTFVTGFDYDFAGNLKKVTDPAARDTLYQYDDFGRLVKTTSPNTGITLYVYDAAGNLTTKKEDFGGTSRTTTYTYDGLDRLTGINLPTNSDWVYTYDGSATLNQMGRLASVTNGVVTTDREYHPSGDLKLERTTIGGASYVVQYDYDASGNLSSIQGPSGTTSVYAYSGLRPKTITVNPGANQQVVRNIGFDPFGGRTRAEFPPYDSGAGLNTVISTRSYNKRNQVATVRVTSPAGDVVHRTFEYARTTGGGGPTDPGPNLDEITDIRDNSQSRFFFYDALDRLSQSKQTSGASLHQYVYDANGNRTAEFAGGAVIGTTYVSGTDRVASSGFSYEFGSIVTYYAHDAYGNRIWEGLLAPYSGQPMHFYDEQNRLVEYRHWTNLSSPWAQYTYDAFGRRVRKVYLGSTTLYFYDSAGHLIEERALATNATRSYVWLEDEPVGIVDSGTPPKYSWIHNDYLGMPIAVTSTPVAGDAQTIWRANYAPYGLAGVFPDPDGDGQQFSLALRFPGQYYDGETNYHYNWHRFYDPSIGRYLSADPLGQTDGPNLYAYVQNNPTNSVDPTGEITVRDVANFSAGFGDSLLLGVPGLTRDDEGFVDPCSDAYDYGAYASFGFGVGRLGYAALAKGVSKFASSGAAASAARSRLKSAFGLNATKNVRKPNLSKYNTDDELRAGAGRTNPATNAYGAGLAAASGYNASRCECRE